MLPVLAVALVLLVAFGATQLRAQPRTQPGTEPGPQPQPQPGPQPIPGGEVLRQGLPFRSLIMEKATERGLDPCLVAGIIEVESSFNPDAQNPADPSLGLMQITPIALLDTQQRGNISASVTFQQLRNPEINVEVGTEFLVILRDRHNINFPDEVDAFNVGPDLQPRNPAYVERVKSAMRRACA